MLAEIYLTDQFIRRQLFRGSVSQYFSLKHKISPVGDGKRFLDVVIRDQDTDVFCFEFGNDVLDILYRDRVNTGKGLIKQDKFGIGSQGTGDFGPASFSTGK